MRAQKVAIIFTGGTISMSFDEKRQAVIPSTFNKEILGFIDKLKHKIEIQTIDFLNIPSTHMNYSILTELKTLIEKILKKDDIKGIVVTHGTDTLEETAYFLDLTLNNTKPVVVVGSMKNTSETGYDGPDNLKAAVYTVVSPQAKDKGVMIVMNNAIYAAREATKLDTFRVNAFASPEYGPLGLVDGDTVVFRRNIEKREIIPSDKLENNVQLIKCFIGMHSDLIKYYVDNHVKGIVLEGFGRGNIPPDMVDGVKYALSRDIPVVLVSRCLTGRVSDVYGYEGGGKHLKELGVIFGGDLSAQKALIKLSLVLNLTKDLNQIRKFFESN